MGQVIHCLLVNWTYQLADNETWWWDITVPFRLPFTTWIWSDYTTPFNPPGIYGVEKLSHGVSVWILDIMSNSKLTCPSPGSIILSSNPHLFLQHYLVSISYCHFLRWNLYGVFEFIIWDGFELRLWKISKSNAYKPSTWGFNSRAPGTDGCQPSDWVSDECKLRTLYGWQSSTSFLDNTETAYADFTEFNLETSPPKGGGLYHYGIFSSTYSACSSLFRS